MMLYTFMVLFSSGSAPSLCYSLEVLSRFNLRQSGGHILGTDYTHHMNLSEELKIHGSLPFVSHGTWMFSDTAGWRACMRGVLSRRF